MQSILVRRAGVVEKAADVDPAWLEPGSDVVLWVDLEDPDDADRALLADVFRFHEVAIEHALAEIHHPKIEMWDGVLYLILHGIATGEGAAGFVTQDVDFFVGPNYLVTVHYGSSRSIEAEAHVCALHADVLAEGPVSVLHRIVDRLVDHYGPEVDIIESRLEDMENRVFESDGNPMRELLALKRDIASLRRVTLPQRDAVGRLARREFPQITEALAYRFRDVHDHFVRLSDEALFLQDRVTGLLDAHLSNQSNRLNQVMKVLTVIATIFMPLTVLTGAWGMNVPLPHLPGGPAMQFWWVVALMIAASGVMLWVFRKMRWM
ncbi:MAG TPA: magnesium transporter CorA family protein [Vicinamibacterales bacterium]|nr:magnesium transporter CorA family protein [Vicinamibacterales bacterium]